MQWPFMRWLPEWWAPGTVRADLLAGLTGAVVVLPQGVAFATLAGLPPQYGLYAGQLAGSVLSSMPSSGSFNRSAVSTEAGARTPLAAASAAVFLVVILGGVAPLATHLPLAVVAGLLFVVARGLIDLPEMRRLWRDEPLERVPLGVTLVGTVTLSLEWAILLGITSTLLARGAAR